MTRTDEPAPGVYARLRVEQRIVGLISLLGLLHFGWLGIWLALGLEPAALARLEERAWALGLVALASLIASAFDVALRLPTPRWPRLDDDRGPSPLALSLAGSPSLVVWPLLNARDRRARGRFQSGAPAGLPGEVVEQAFASLLATPRISATSFGLWLGAATLILAAIIGASVGGGWTLALVTAISLATLLPLVSLGTSRIRSMLVPEYLSAPRPDPLSIPIQRSVALRLGGPAGLALAGAVVVPVLVAALVTRPPTPASTWLAILGLGLVVGLVTLTLLLGDVERDVGRASRQVATVAQGEIPKPMAVETFATAELRGLVAAVDRLVGRISDANVHKYVLIERGHEADRLKSQFLANMSHDLRSPLNSVIGFSDLLTSGIEGELAPEHHAMLELINATGKALLKQIDDILDTAKLEAGRMELVREPTPPATLISRAIQAARLRLPETVDFDTTFAPGLPPTFTDPYRSVQALENVLMFAAEGIDQGRVQIACEAPRSPTGSREVVIRIVSPRAPVPLRELEQARRGFFRLPGASGLGLGLPIATSILELQGGELRIEDRRAAMAFELRFPALTPRRNPVLRRG